MKRMVNILTRAVFVQTNNAVAFERVELHKNPTGSGTTASEAIKLALKDSRVHSAAFQANSKNEMMCD